jgi:competence protein ComEC
VDVGSSDDWSVAEHLKSIGVPHIDCLIITHPHLDHIRGICDLDEHNLFSRNTIFYRDSNAFPIETRNMSPNDRDVANYINKLNEQCVVHPSNLSTNPLDYFVNGGVKISIWPVPGFFTDDLNTYSGIYVFEYAGKKVVLTGDNNKEILREMIKNLEIANSIKEADILLAPHHGRTSDFCEEFFDIVNPSLTIISDKAIEHETQEDSSDCYKGKGISVNQKIRYTLTTRNDGSIKLKIFSDGHLDIKSNLNPLTQIQNQRYQRLIWGLRQGIAQIFVGKSTHR